MSAPNHQMTYGPSPPPTWAFLGLGFSSVHTCILDQAMMRKAQGVEGTLHRYLPPYVLQVSN